MRLDFIETPFISHQRALRVERERSARLGVWVVVLAVVSACGWLGFLLVVFKF